MAARLADRIGLSVGYHPDRIRWALSLIDEALARVGRDRHEVRVGLFGPLAVMPDRTSGLAALRSRTAAWAHMSSFKGNDLGAQPDQLRRVTEVLREGYDYRYHGKLDEPDNPNDAAVDEEFCDWYGVGGPPSYVLDRFGELVELGVDWFCVTVTPDEREAFAASVMEPLRDLRR
jgi:alkanesulfonate monooxygenase SsuD/methylene tetrahydromethanopterin reductase-like flavin-dependent oxidoreductase (luciferase family)